MTSAVPVAGEMTESETLAVAVNDPDTPLSVTVTVPTVAALVAVNVTSDVPVELTAPKDAVTPVGRPVALKATVPLNPFCAAMVVVPEAVSPRGNDRLAGAKASVKLGAAVTVREMVAEALRVPDVPVTVMVEVPIVAELLAMKVSELAAVALAGLKTAVTPDGSPVAARETVPVKPFCPAIEIALLPVAVLAMLRVGVPAVRVKLGATTVRVIVAVLLSVPETPVIVTG